jgi:peptidoglycan/xylan/chitin deacetylase (PgdA/CDA1 family)
MRAISLLFHDVFVDDPAESGFNSPAADRYKLSLADFDAQIEGIARVRSDAPLVRLKPDTTVRLKADPTYTPFLITFDDGGVSYHAIVADRLEARGWRGHCFVSTDFIGKPGFLDAAQIRELDARGHAIGGHSASHPARLSACTFAQMVDEWRRCRHTLEDLLGHTVDVASVPGGYFSRAVGRAARAAGIRVLFTSEPVTSIDSDRGYAVVGRFVIRQGHAQDVSQRFVAAAPWTRSAAWLTWNAKGLVKPLLGASYRPIADRLCAIRDSLKTRPRWSALGRSS